MSRAPQRRGTRANVQSRLLRLAYEALPVGVLISSDDDWANPELRRMWRIGDGALDADTFDRNLEPVDRRDAYDPDPHGRRLSPLAIARAGGTPEPGRYRFTRGDRTMGVARVSAARLCAPDGSAVGAVAVAIDETSRHDAERMRESFLGILGHELRTPIASIVAGAELLQAEGLKPAIRSEVGASLAAEANRLHGLVEQMIELARLERRGGLVMEPVQLAHVVRRVVERERSRRPRLTIDVESPRSVFAAAGDEGFVAQVLTILIDNAAKHAGGSGRIRVVVEGEAESVGVHVLDDGRGLAVADGDAIFQLFNRGRVYDADDSSGTGIGLFVARAVIEAMGGRISAENRREGGADVSFSLPIVHE